MLRCATPPDFSTRLSCVAGCCRGSSDNAVLFPGMIQIDTSSSSDVEVFVCCPNMSQSIVQ